jgi:hypothetical protein
MVYSQPLSHASGSVEPLYVRVGSGALMVSQDFAGVGAAKGGGSSGDVGEGTCCADDQIVGFSGGSSGAEICCQVRKQKLELCQWRYLLSRLGDRVDVRDLLGT